VSALSQGARRQRDGIFVDKLHNCDVMIREDVRLLHILTIRLLTLRKITTDEFIDVLIGAVLQLSSIRQNC
jgi:hypothetical protein